jgi:ribonucrease Y
MSTTIILSIVLAIILGCAIGYFIRQLKANSELSERQAKGDQIVEKAKNDAGDIKYRARKEAKDIIKDERHQFERECDKREQEFKQTERDITKKELAFEQRIEDHNRNIERIAAKEEEVEAERGKIDDEISRYRQKQGELADRLTEVTGMSKEDAKNELLKSMEDDARVDFSKVLTRLEEETKEESEKISKRIIGMAIHRFSGEYVADQTISSVELPSDDVKGKLIGREGRNIRAFEQICGVDLIIDDTPEVVVISSFNVVRREIARQTINKLLSDGRIHPAKIEEFYQKSKGDMDKQLRELGEKAQMEIGIHGIHPEILKLIGALNWRTSYTQNQYQHAIETAFLTGLMASEMKLNVKQARRAGLLHDIGKVIDASAEGSHALIGAAFAKKHGESPDVVHAIRAHHEDEKPQSLLAHLVASADAISGARPGARKALMESYISRLTDIEQIVNSFDGVTNSYAISGGREVRVLVENKKVSDDGTVTLSREIAKKIEANMSYPGTIKVTVLRETKSVGVAR